MSKNKTSPKGGGFPALGLDADILAALNNVAALKRAGRNIVAVNMSLGYWYTWQNGLCTTTYTGVFSDLAAMGITPVIAAGNTAFNNGMFMNGLISDLVNFDQPLLTADQILDRIRRFLRSS